MADQERSLFGRLFYRIIVFILRLYLKICRGFQVKGRNNLPKQGPFLVVANHQHFIDPIMVGVALFPPHMLNYMAKEEIFNYPVFAQALYLLGAFPVKRGKPDRAALNKSIKLLKGGGILCMFPEGTRQRTGELGQAKRGIIQIIKKSGAGVLPVYLDINSGKRPVTVNIGKTFQMEGLNKVLSREEVKQKAEFIMEHIRALKPRK